MGSAGADLRLDNAAPPQDTDALIADGAAAVDAADAYLRHCHAHVSAAVSRDGRVDPDRFESGQRAAHGLAWIATYVEALRQLQAWVRRCVAADRLGIAEHALFRLGFHEYLNQLTGGIPVGQSEIVRPVDLGVADAADRLRADRAVQAFATGTDAAGLRRVLARCLDEGDRGEDLLADDSLDMMRDQFARYAAEKVAPHCHAWHLEDRLIPMSVVEELAELGVFGITIPEAHGGLGLSKSAMCVVTEALSRAYLGVGSLGTRAEIAGELIAQSGTEEQKARFLPGLADGTILSTAVFTEPDIGSDLAHLKTRAVRDGDVYRIYGAKTWITQGARADVMTLLVRTDPAHGDHRGLSMFLAEKPRGTEADPFPVEGMTGSEIGTLGYRGLKEYDIAFDGFAVRAENLLGGVEGQGFRQLMNTFESARIQTAARAVGVAANALDLGLAYAQDRAQFGKPLIRYPRIADKLAMMAVEVMMARQLTLFASRIKDEGRRSDVEAGMAKLLAARIAWANADSALQIHGGHGYALEAPVSRVLVRCAHPEHFRGDGRDPGPGDCPRPVGAAELMAAGRRLALVLFILAGLAGPAQAAEVCGAAEPADPDHSERLQRFAEKIGLRHAEAFAGAAATINRTGRAPDCYLPKREARRKGWSPGQDLCRIRDGLAIGAYPFENREKLLPRRYEGSYRIADLDYACGDRGARRLVYVRDAPGAWLMWVTLDHYKSYIKVPAPAD